jgi:hypothetical protein
VTLEPLLDVDLSRLGLRLEVTTVAWFARAIFNASVLIGVPGFVAPFTELAIWPKPVARLLTRRDRDVAVVAD